MSRIAELLEQYCPDRVEFVKLGELSEYSKIRINARFLDETNFVGVDNLLQNSQGKENAKYLPNTLRLTAYQDGDILIGNIRPYLKKIWLANNDGGCSGDVLAIHILNKTKLLSAFLYYILSSDNFFSYSMQYAKGAKMPRGDKQKILNYPIPVPSLVVQQEIVNILDDFPDLTADLTAELTARREQYKYYLNLLIDKSLTHTES